MLNLTKLDVNKLIIINNKVYTLQEINVPSEEEETLNKFNTQIYLTFE